MCGVGTAEREQLAAIVADRNRPRKQVERARIVLASADRYSAQRVAQSIGVSRPTVWRWQQRFAESGVEGLLRDKTRKPGKAPLAAQTTARVVALTPAFGGQALHRTAASGDPLDWPGDGQGDGALGGFGTAHLAGAQATTASPAHLQALARIPALPPNWPTSSGSILIRRPTPWCFRSTKRARSRRSTAPSPNCRSSPGAARL